MRPNVHLTVNTSKGSDVDASNSILIGGGPSSRRSSAVERRLSRAGGGERKPAIPVQGHKDAWRRRFSSRLHSPGLDGYGSREGSAGVTSTGDVTGRFFARRSQRGGPQAETPCIIIHPPPLPPTRSDDPFVLVKGSPLGGGVGGMGDQGGGGSSSVPHSMRRDNKGEGEAMNELSYFTNTKLSSQSIQLFRLILNSRVDVPLEEMDEEMTMQQGLLYGKQSYEEAAAPLGFDANRARMEAIAAKGDYPSRSPTPLSISEDPAAASTSGPKPRGAASPPISPSFGKSGALLRNIVVPHTTNTTTLGGVGNNNTATTTNNNNVSGEEDDESIQDSVSASAYRMVSSVSMPVRKVQEFMPHYLTVKRDMEMEEMDDIDFQKKTTAYIDYKLRKNSKRVGVFLLRREDRYRMEYNCFAEPPPIAEPPPKNKIRRRRRSSAVVGGGGKEVAPSPAPLSAAKRKSISPSTLDHAKNTPRPGKGRSRLSMQASSSPAITKKAGGIADDDEDDEDEEDEEEEDLSDMDYVTRVLHRQIREHAKLSNEDWMNASFPWMPPPDPPPTTIAGNTTPPTTAGFSGGGGGATATGTTNNSQLLGNNRNGPFSFTFTTPLLKPSTSFSAFTSPRPPPAGGGAESLPAIMAAMMGGGGTGAVGNPGILRAKQIASSVAVLEPHAPRVPTTAHLDRIIAMIRETPDKAGLIVERYLRKVQQLANKQLKHQLTLLAAAQEKAEAEALLNSKNNSNEEHPLYKVTGKQGGPPSSLHPRRSIASAMASGGAVRAAVTAAASAAGEGLSTARGGGGGGGLSEGRTEESGVSAAGNATTASTTTNNNNAGDPANVSTTSKSSASLATGNSLLSVLDRPVNIISYKGGKRQSTVGGEVDGKLLPPPPLAGLAGLSKASADNKKVNTSASSSVSNSARGPPPPSAFTATLQGKPSGL